MILHELIGDSWTSILIHAIFWALISLWIFTYIRRREVGTVGLPVAYVCLMSIIHFGALVYLLPWYDAQLDPYLRDSGVNPELVSAGFAISTWGIFFFAIGVWVSDRIVSTPPSQRVMGISSVTKFGRQLVFAGTICFFLIFPFSNRIASGASIASAGVNLTVVGLCLLGFNSLRQGSNQRLRVLLGTLTIPSVTMLVMGFVGYGVTALVQIFTYVISFSRIRWWYWPVGALVFWGTLSFFVTYMAGRNEIRSVVWKQATLYERLEVVTNRFANTEVFSLTNNQHLYAIDTRLNQNALVGRCVEYMQTSRKEYAQGKSLYIAAVAWIPRILWPTKPAFGGSGSLVADYTGMTFEANTSVGVGQVLEFYLNFGITGVAVGFLFMGFVIRFWDKKAITSLGRSEYWEYVKYHLMGVCALQPGGMLAEVVASSAAAWVLASALQMYFAGQNDGTVTTNLAKTTVPR